MIKPVIAVAEGTDGIGTVVVKVLEEPGMMTTYEEAIAETRAVEP